MLCSHHLQADTRVKQPAYTTPTSSPPQRSDIIGLRNGAVPRPATTPRPLASKGRIQKTPKKRKGRERSDKDKVVLEKPLSEMGVEWKHSMDEIAVYVNRSAEERKNETDSDRKQPGRVKRPMNSFMLYRKAFQNHTKAYCEHNNHQVVSKVCGASWDMEPENIRNQFAEWAKQERANHQQAHPGYKFAPAKPNKATKRKNESDDEASDLESYDWESGQRIRRPRSRTGTPMPDHHKLYEMPYYHPPQQPLPQYGQPQAMTNSHNAVLSSYGYTNPHKQMPSPYTSMVLGGQTGQYLSSNSVANQSYGQRGYVEDVSYHKAPSPGTPYHHPMQPALLDSYVSTPQQHTPPAAQIMDGRADAGVYTSMDTMFDPNKPMRLRDHGIDTSGPFDVNFGGNTLGDQFDDRHDYLHRFVNDLGGEQLFQDQQAQQLLRGNDESWDIQPLNEAQAGEGYDDWNDVDPSLSQPYELNDPSLSEVYPARD